MDEDQRREADELQSAKDVHFKAEGSAFLAKQVAASIEAGLAVEKCSSVRTVVATERIGEVPNCRATYRQRIFRTGTLRAILVEIMRITASR